MSDLIEEIKQKQRQRAWETAITTVIIFIAMAAVIFFSVKSDRDKQRELNTYGGAVGVENQTYHRVTIRLFLHDSADAPVHTIEPRGHWVIRDSMTKWEVSNFPPINWLDSALFIFDDTLYLWQGGQALWYADSKKHYIRESMCWKYESLVVRPRSRYHPALYRPLRVYYLTEEDYERAVEVNRPKTYINPQL